MRRFLITLLATLSASAPAAALQLIVWDRDLSTKLGDGESSGGKVTVRLAGDYSGPVVVLFAPSDEERARNAFPGLKSRYVGSLVNGQLNIMAEERSAAQSITKFLSGYRLTATVQVASAALSLPGLRKAPPSAPNR
ncbi:hypothetical protein [Deinococcus actinosclerus]|uniref:Uncharacterized protein n=1 Tax=Deinococcus actinosclerus TaxID=1768108 RepID=A0ABN4KAH4_9DEIO|nr:hypothetical protein [Deinococcus actinosclerus]ALW90200.1 hypothetical protein AUC44_15960 [Deinococcus actinosclerus]